MTRGDECTMYDNGCLAGIGAGEHRQSGIPIIGWAVDSTHPSLGANKLFILVNVSGKVCVPVGIH